MPGEQHPQLSQHDAAMVAKVDQASASVDQQAGVAKPAAVPSEPSKPERPADVPEKFWDPDKGSLRTDELLKSYRELEAAKSKPAEPAADPTKTGEDPAAKAVEAAKLDMGKLSQEFAESGKLSDDSYKALEAQGFGRDVVDTYIAGQQALAAQQAQQGYELAGGKDNYQAMATWAQAALTPADIQAFDAAVTSGSPAQMKQAIVALKAQYEAAKGTDPKLVSGSPAAGPNGAFASRAEVTQAMRDPRYKADPAYRAEVERRIGLMDSF